MSLLISQCQCIASTSSNLRAHVGKTPALDHDPPGPTKNKPQELALFSTHHGAGIADPSYPITKERRPYLGNVAPPLKYVGNWHQAWYTSAHNIPLLRNPFPKFILLGNRSASNRCNKLLVYRIPPWQYPKQYGWTERLYVAVAGRADTRIVRCRK